MKSKVFLFLVLSLLFLSILSGSLIFDMPNQSKEIESSISEDFETMSAIHSEDLSDRRISTCGRKRCTC
ncbi:MAG: hypothetical protein FWG98_10930 [Candidatus Cloacimonetes bacterium]|nr:hypothetical protein [Candidatus Cloacimonadota bacterium]